MILAHASSFVARLVASLQAFCICNNMGTQLLRKETPLSPVARIKLSSKETVYYHPNGDNLTSALHAGTDRQRIPHCLSGALACKAFNNSYARHNLRYYVRLKTLHSKQLNFPQSLRRDAKHYVKQIRAKALGADHDGKCANEVNCAARACGRAYPPACAFYAAQERTRQRQAESSMPVEQMS
eukprot:6201007-Pleurochrysis_carterae.AAC.1